MNIIDCRNIEFLHDDPTRFECEILFEGLEQWAPHVNEVGGELWNAWVTDEDSISTQSPPTISEQGLRDETLRLRQAAYNEESDPLFLEWQYDQTPEAEKAWRDKVAEIKERFPLK